VGSYWPEADLGASNGDVGFSREPTQADMLSLFFRFEGLRTGTKSFDGAAIYIRTSFPPSHEKRDNLIATSKEASMS
jgi:hypothetical protein